MTALSEVIDAEAYDRFIEKTTAAVKESYDPVFRAVADRLGYSGEVSAKVEITADFNEEENRTDVSVKLAPDFGPPTYDPFQNVLRELVNGALNHLIHEKTL